MRSIFRVVAMDFLWHGRSQTEDFDEQVLPALVDQVLDVLDTLKLGQVHLEGQSLGGWVASLVTLKYPQRVDKLVLTTATGYLPDEGAVPSSKRTNPAATIDQALAVFEVPAMRMSANVWNRSFSIVL
jgi:2-hydroxy-6-oxonona-2,4-dienedioate hydrolase